MEKKEEPKERADDFYDMLMPKKRRPDDRKDLRREGFSYILLTGFYNRSLDYFFSARY